MGTVCLIRIGDREEINPCGVALLGLWAGLVVLQGTIKALLQFLDKGIGAQGTPGSGMSEDGSGRPHSTAARR